MRQPTQNEIIPMLENIIFHDAALMAFYRKPPCRANNRVVSEVVPYYRGGLTCETIHLHFLYKLPFEQITLFALAAREMKIETKWRNLHRLTMLTHLMGQKIWHESAPLHKPLVCHFQLSLKISHRVSKEYFKIESQ